MKKPEERDQLIYSRTIKEKYRPDHFFLKNTTGWILMIITLIVEACIIYEFVVANRIPVNLSIGGLGGFGVIAAFLIVLDILMPITFIALKKYYCNSDITPFVLIIGGFAIVLIFVASMLAVRWSLVTPETIVRGSKTYAQAIIFSLLPIGTSMATSLIFWMSYNPLLNKMYEVEQRAYSEGEKLMNVQSELAKYNSDEGDYFTRLVEEEHLRYKQKHQEITAMAFDCKVAFRLKLAEILADPKSTTIICGTEVEPYVEVVEMLEIPNCLKLTKNKMEESSHEKIY